LTDNFKLTLHYGDGYGTQLKSGPTEGAFNTGTSELETIGIGCSRNKSAARHERCNAGNAVEIAAHYRRRWQVQIFS
jgi:hypothetical protein